MKKGHFNWHNLLMVVCVIPIAVVLFGLIGKGSSLTNISGGSLWPLGLLLLCPLMHLFMMRGMNHGSSSHQSKDEPSDQDPNSK